MPMASMAAGGTMSPVDFKQKVITNVEHVITRVKGIAPQNFSEEVVSKLRSLLGVLKLFILSFN